MLKYATKYTWCPSIFSKDICQLIKFKQQAMQSIFLKAIIWQIYQAFMWLTIKQEISHKDYHHQNILLINLTHMGFHRRLEFNCDGSTFINKKKSLWITRPFFFGGYQIKLECYKPINLLFLNLICNYFLKWKCDGLISIILCKISRLKQIK